MKRQHLASLVGAEGMAPQANPSGTCAPPQSEPPERAALVRKYSPWDDTVVSIYTRYNLQGRELEDTVESEYTMQTGKQPFYTQDGRRTAG